MDFFIRENRINFEHHNYRLCFTEPYFFEYIYLNFLSTLFLVLGIYSLDQLIYVDTSP